MRELKIKWDLPVWKVKVKLDSFCQILNDVYQVSRSSYLLFLGFLVVFTLDGNDGGHVEQIFILA